MSLEALVLLKAVSSGYGYTLICLFYEYYYYCLSVKDRRADNLLWAQRGTGERPRQAVRRHAAMKLPLEGGGAGAGGRSPRAPRPDPGPGEQEGPRE